MELYNTALIQDEVLVNISKVIEDGWPAGPSFLCALGSLIEAAVIHDNVFYDPMRQTQRKDLASSLTIASSLNESKLVQELIGEGVLTLFPERQEIDEHLEKARSTYRSDRFLLDYYYGRESFSSADPEGYASEFINLTELLNKAPGVFTTDRLIQDEGFAEDGSFIALTAPGMVAHLLGFNRQDMIQLEGLTHKAQGYVELTHSLEIDFYPVLTALPYQIGAIKQYAGKAKTLYESIIEKAVSLDDPADDAREFSRVPIPPLAQIVMTRSKGSIEALAGEVIDLRHRHRAFRKYLTDYEREWETATTRAERFQLRNEFDNAWKTFVANMEKPSTRIIYTLWDIFKNPLAIPAALGDKLRAKGHELSIIGKVRGLHDFWRDLVSSPAPERNMELLSGLFPRLAAEKEWQLSRDLANSINSFLNTKTDKSSDTNESK